MALTKDEILKLAKRLISIKNNKIDLSTGTVLQDIGVEAQAEILTSLSEDIERVRQQQAYNPDYFTDEEADQLALPYGITRNPPTKASGNITFGTTNLPSSTSIVIPAGTTVIGTNNNGVDITYVTTEQGILTPSSVFNEQTGYYETTVKIEASVAGSASNIGIGFINQLGTSISGISAVYNKDAIVNGSDTESTASLINRVLLTWRGRNLNTEQGILAWTYSNPKVEEAIVVGPNSEYSIRGPGAVDVYVRGTTAVSGNITFQGKVKEVVLNPGPVINPDNIIVNIDGTNYDINSNIFYFVKDTETIFQNSDICLDKIVFTEDGLRLITSDQTQVSVSFSYNGLIQALQDMYDDTEQRLITGDIMAKGTTETQIIMEFGITTESGYDKNAVSTLVRNNIEVFVNNLPLNTAVRMSDIVNIIEETNGVSYTSLPFLQFHKVGEENPDKQVADIEASPLEYFRVESSNIIIG